MALMGLYSELHEQRLSAVVSALRASEAASVADLGCGSGTLVTRLLADPSFKRIFAVDQSGSALQELRRQAPVAEAERSGRLRLDAGSYLEFASHLLNVDAVVMVETIEHLDPGHLSLAEALVFGRYGPDTVVVTTPNVEFNPLYGLGPGELRDPDHRFEWSRDRFRRWAQGVARRHRYRVRFRDIGELDPDRGSPTQMAVFSAEAAPGSGSPGSSRSSSTQRSAGGSASGHRRP